MDTLSIITVFVLVFAIIMMAVATGIIFDKHNKYK